MVKDYWSPGDRMSEDFHDARGRLSPAEKVGHEAHGPLGVREEGLESLAEPVQARLAVLCHKDSVLRTLAITSEKETELTNSRRFIGFLLGL
jgi:hypothetical protein